MLQPNCSSQGLTEGKEYYFGVKAVNVAGESESLRLDNATVPKTPISRFCAKDCNVHAHVAVEPSRPRELQVSDVTPQGIGLKWMAPECDGGSPVTSYVIVMRRVEEEKFKKLATTDGII